MFMLLLHLFCRKEAAGLYITFPTVRGVPFIYYLALFGDACVPMYCFASGYGLYRSLEGKESLTKNFGRIFKLFINYWIVLLLFTAIGFFAGKPGIPGSLTKFVLNFFLVSYSYNGAWWFLQTYIILVFLAPFLINLIKTYRYPFLLMVSGTVYFLSYVQRIRQVVDFGNSVILNTVVNAIVLVGTSQFGFVIGAVFAKDSLYSNLYNRFNNLRYKNRLCLLAILLLVLIHSFFETMFIAPFTAITFICLFNLMDKNILVNKVLSFLGDHSTNIWLTHMFFYLTIFPELIFGPRYPILIFIWLLILCLISSYCINFMYSGLIRIIGKKAVILGYREPRAVRRA